MSFEDHVEATKRYLEGKYSVSLRDIDVETPLLGSPRYDSTNRKAIVPYIAWIDVPAVVISFGILEIPSILSQNTKTTYQLTRAAVERLTEPEPSFQDQLAHHEATKDPNVPALQKLTYKFDLSFSSVMRRPPNEYNWSEIIEWMNHGDREKRLAKLKERLDIIGATNGEELCAELYDMTPTQFVLEHRMLRGLRGYSRFVYFRKNTERHLEKARNDFLQHSGSPERAEKYMALLPRSVY